MAAFCKVSRVKNETTFSFLLPRVLNFYNIPQLSSLLGWEKDGFPCGARIFSLKWKISAPVSG
jgi:hypothetical protein